MTQKDVVSEEQSTSQSDAAMNPTDANTADEAATVSTSDVDGGAGVAGIADAAEDTEAAEEVSMGYRIFSVVRSVFVYLLAAAIVLAAFFFAADRSPNKSMFGYRYYTVLTDSMVPEFYSGDMVFVKICGADAIAVNDVITFNPSSSSDAYLTHRVTEKIDDYQGTGVTCFKTKGDANNSDDSFLIDESRVIGKVKFHVPKLGLVMRFLQLRWYFVVPIIIMIFAFFELLKKYFEMQSENADDEDERVDEHSDDTAEQKV